MMKRFIILLTLMLEFCTIAATAPIHKTVEEGNKHYSRQQFDQALNKYRDAQIQSPEAAELHYNIGNALYQKKDYAGAMEEFRKAIMNSDDVNLHTQAYYNIGNALFKAAEDSITMQNHQGAINNMVESLLQYKKALELNPEDEDAKVNYEHVATILKQLRDQQQNQQQQNQQGEQQQQEQQQQSGGENQEGEENQEQQQQQGAEEQQTAEEQDQAEQQKQEGEEDENAEEEQNPQQARKEGEMTEEEAKRLLDILKASEEEIQKEQQRLQAPLDGQPRGKQW